MNPIDQPSRPQVQINRLTMLVAKLKQQRDKYKEENKALKITVKAMKSKSKKVL